MARVQRWLSPLATGDDDAGELNAAGGPGAPTLEEHQPAGFDGGDGVIPLRQAGEKVPVRLLGLVDVEEGGAGEVRGHHGREAVPGRDGGDDGPQGDLVIALGPLGGAGLPKVRAAGADGELVRGAGVLQLDHHIGAAIGRRIAPADGDLDGGLWRRHASRLQFACGAGWQVAVRMPLGLRAEEDGGR